MLSTPATDMDRYAKSHRSGADVCMIDLEDSVAPWRKEEARRSAEAFFTAPSSAGVRCGLRINAVTGPDGLRDLLAIEQYPVKPDVLVVPMVESARDLEIVERVLAPSCPQIDLFAVVETPRGIDNLAEIAAASGRLRALVFGAADYSFATGTSLAWEALVHARARLVNSARAANVEAVDSPVFAIGDADGLRREVPLSFDLGFSGKIAVHPSQIPIINEAFSPDPGTLEKARRIVAAGRSGSVGIGVVDGAMVGAPFFEASRRLIEEFGSPADRVLSSTGNGSAGNGRKD